MIYYYGKDKKESKENENQIKEEKTFKKKKLPVMK